VSGDNRELDERVWQAWLDKNGKEDREFFVKVKVGGAVSLVLVVGFLLWWLF
jgi:hypothetical protein